MRRPARGRPSFRETLEANNRADRYYAAMAGVDPKAQNVIAPKRDRVRRPVDGKPEAPLEKDIQRTILDALALRRDVVFVGRFNRGQAIATNGYGDTRYTQFNNVPGFPDIHGLLLGGKAFYIEVKRPHPNYVKPSREQQNFLDMARNGGAYAGVAVSLEEAMAILP